MDHHPLKPSSPVKLQWFVCALASFLGFLFFSYALLSANIRNSATLPSFQHLVSNHAAISPVAEVEYYYSSVVTNKEIRALAPVYNAAVVPLSSSVEGECDVFDGEWVYDEEAYPLYAARQCAFLSGQVNCRRNGRPDSDYQHWRWKPKGCELPRYGGTEMLERWRGKRVVIVGDSLNRNMWESLACILYSSMQHKSRAYVNAKSHEYKMFRAMDYDCTVEFYWSPFLVKLEQRKDHSKVLNLDELPDTAQRWIGADVMVFNSGHWWTHRGKMRAWDWYERRGRAAEMGEYEAFNRAFRTWARWVGQSVDTAHTRVFFRSISPEHKLENWCYNQTTPFTNETYKQYFPRTMISVVERNIQKMRNKVKYLNITHLSEYRKDAHTSVYTTRQGNLLTLDQQRQPNLYADCSHWCLPGLPDTWNVLLFASLMGTPSNVS
ncbi:protein trichome birefringence-like 40 [Ananas comosus]|uniref:Protein trichome birefringence-like 40 n=1 Tax=Ananas comosus TaxID=4615 RepID=A0A6P5GJV9_ANACO|nr:protein trichome birefringence-like 40 [Ananas comosus]